MCVNAPHNCEIIDIVRERISRTGLRSTSFVATRTFKMSYKTVLDLSRVKSCSTVCLISFIYAITIAVSLIRQTNFVSSFNKGWKQTPHLWRYLTLIELTDCEKVKREMQ